MQCVITCCVRCNKSFEQHCHPMSHHSSICRECSNVSAETISDQNLQNIKMYAKHSDEIIERIKMSEWFSIRNPPPIDGYGFDEGEGISECILLCYTCKDDDSDRKMIYRRVGHYLKMDGKDMWSLAEPLTWDCLPKNSDDLLEVTHWMNIPEPPE